jgi:hypothetical protein
MTALDPRLAAAGLAVTVRDLITLWAEHCPPTSVTPINCASCGHTYTPTEPLCPTAAVVRPLLQRRRREVPTEELLAALTYVQYRDLVDRHPHIAVALRTQASPHTGTDRPEPDALFDPSAYRRQAGLP